MSVIKSHIRGMAPYLPPLEGRNPGKFLLMDFNERIEPVASHIKTALHQFIDDDMLQVYPAYGDFTNKLAGHAEVPPDRVMLTNGSDQGIEIIIRAICREGDEIIIPMPSFDMYRQVALTEHLNIVEPAYTTDHKFPTREILDCIDSKTKMIVIPNPNNPTSTIVRKNEILEIAGKAPHAGILVDECYFEYTRMTLKDYLDNHPNLFITRTFSKTWGMPSIRLGYILTNAENIRDLLKIRGPYDMNMLAIVAASAALDDPSYMQSYVDEINSVSMPMLTSFLDEVGIPYWPSSTNFVLTLPKDPDRINDRLHSAGILVRPKKDAQGNPGLRITVGGKEHTEKLIATLKSAMQD